MRRVCGAQLKRYNQPVNGILEAADEVGGFFRTQGWRFCVIDGLAVQRWGEPRTTLDADFLLLTGWGEEATFVDAILVRFESRIPEARDFALSRRVLLIRGSNGTPVDVSLGALPYELNLMDRCVEIEFAPDVTLPCCTAEDLLIMKLFASRPGDLADAESVIQRQPALDASYILNHLRELSELKEDPEMLARAQALLEKRA